MDHVDERLMTAIEELHRGILSLFGELTPDDWARPSPCADWDVRDLAAHLSGGLATFTAAPIPEPPQGWVTDKSGTALATAWMVAARATWSPEEVVDEFRRASRTLLDQWSTLDAAGWTMPAAGPPGVRDVRGLVRNRLLDQYIHLLDLRVALERPLDLEAEPVAFAECVSQALEFAGWGAVKRAGLRDDTRIRLSLGASAGVGAVTRDLVVVAGRGALEDPQPTAEERVEGTVAAFLFVATERSDWTTRVGGIRAIGSAARRFLDGYVIWA
jgi:uncharacterized protein (TIGR03083 family)